ncbi:MAG: DUF5916 domain-containing protein [Bacteroidota bacterium]
MFFLVVLALNSFSQTKNIREDFQIHPKPTEEKMTIDGELNEEVWKDAAVVGDFSFCYPVDNQRVPDEKQTQVGVTYNSQYIFFGITCYGENNYVIQTLKRDKDLYTSDGFAVVIDPVNEKTNGFMFGVNAGGAQTEALYPTRIGPRDENGPSGFNEAWDNKWFSEIQSYPDRWTIEIAIPYKSLRFKEGVKNWGINFIRYDASANSIHVWSPVPIEFWEIDLGYTGTIQWDQPPEKVKSNITVIPYALGGVGTDFETDPNSPLNSFQGGMDAKVALTSSLNFDLTVNPNFSQVDVDEQVTNLSLFNIRFPERRLFFLENSDVFEDFGVGPMRPFFSRKIGLDADRKPIPISYGARLSGNVNNDLRIGLMNLQTRESGDFLAQNYTAFAFQQQILSRSIVKGYFNNRSAVNSLKPDYSRNAGLEMVYNSVDGRSSAYGGGGKTFSPGLHSQDYFYVGGAGYYNKAIALRFNVDGVGNNYVADMGFIQGNMYYDAERDTTIRIGYHHGYGRADYTIYVDNPGIISHQFTGAYILDVDSAFSLLNTQLELTYTLNKTNTSKLISTYYYKKVALIFPFSFVDEELLPIGMYVNHSGEMIYNSDQRKSFILTASALAGTFYGGKRSTFRMGVKYRSQPWGNFSFLAERNDLLFPESGSQQSFWLISPKTEINFSKALFWTTFLQYNTQADNFNINSRLQWRFLPMSDVFLVYSDNYAVEFWGPKNRTLVLKVNYWLNL